MISQALLAPLSIIISLLQPSLMQQLYLARDKWCTLEGQRKYNIDNDDDAIPCQAINSDWKAFWKAAKSASKKKEVFGLCKTHNWVNNHCCALYDQIRVQMSSQITLFQKSKSGCYLLGWLTYRLGWVEFYRYQKFNVDFVKIYFMDKKIKGFSVSKCNEKRRRRWWSDGKRKQK